MKLFLLAFISAIMCTNCSNNGNAVNQVLNFTSKGIGELPATVLTEKNRGVAGAFSGIVHNKLIVAGGSYFPDKMPWEGGTKLYVDKIYAFELGKDTLQEIQLSERLPEPLAYGASITLPDGILCIGGTGPVNCSSKVFLIKWDEATDSLVLVDYPELPVPLCFTSAVLSGHNVYVAGGSATTDGREANNYFFRLDLTEFNTSASRWEELPPYPGMARILSVMVAQSNGTHNCLYLFSGRNTNNPDKPVVMNDGLAYDPALQKWEKVQADSPSAFPVMAGAAFPFGSDKIVFVGGASDSTFLIEHRLKKELAISLTHEKTAQANRIKAELLRFYNDHPGFSNQILIYNTQKKSLTISGYFESFCPVTTNAVPFENGAIIACGEIKPGVRSPKIFNIQLLQ